MARGRDGQHRNCRTARMLARVTGWSPALDTRRVVVARERRRVSKRRRGRVRFGNGSRAVGSGCCLTRASWLRA